MRKKGFSSQRAHPLRPATHFTFQRAVYHVNGLRLTFGQPGLDGQVVGSVVGGEEAVYRPNEAMSVGKKARVFVEVEGGPLVTPQDPVFVRVAADGSLDKIGGFARAAGTGLVQWLEARWFKKTNTDEIAVVEVNLP